MRALWQDVRHGLRMLMQSPGFTAVAVLSLALGIGANVTMFSFVNAYLLRPLPYDGGERLVDLTDTHATFGRMSVSYANYLDWRKQNQTFEQMACYRGARVTAKGADTPERLASIQVSAGLLPMLGVKAMLGRLFDDTDDRAGAERTVVLGHDLWQRRFGGAADAIGKTLVLDGDPYTIIGVLPSSFAFPPLRRAQPDLWTPIGLLEQYEWFTSRRNHNGTEGIGRLKKGVTLSEARADLNHVAGQLEQAYPQSNAGCRVAAEPFHRWIVGDTRPALLILMASVLAVLLIVCVNIANLLLVRSSARTQEFAMRRALGAGKLHLVRQLLAENLVLALSGVAAGIAVATWGIDLMGTLLGDRAIGPQGGLLELDANIVLFVFAMAIAIILIFGLAPAWHCLGDWAACVTRDSTRTSTSTKSRSRLRDALVVTEIALALVLMSCAGLMLRSLVHYLQADPGYNPDSAVTLEIHLPGQAYDTDEKKSAFYKSILDRISPMTGVRHVGLTSNLFGQWQSSYCVEGAAIPVAGEEVFAEYSQTSPGLFRAMGISLLAGRFFDESDTRDAPSVVVVDERFAHKWWPNESAVGKRLQVFHNRPDPNAAWAQVVGVVRHVKHYGVDNFSRESIYLPMYQSISHDLTLVVRTQGDPLGLVTPIRQAISAIGPDVPVDDTRTLQAIATERSFMRRMTTTVLGVFALTALLLAALGIYGVMAYSTSRRVNEIGIRMAMGACVADILHMVLRQGAKLALIGVGIGLAGSLALNRLIRSLLFGVTAHDPITLALVVVVLISVALAACYLPARRAARIDPMAALRCE
ncbi:MAG: ABC transporter permease [Sedimentisphaerales bacterium]|nr:ABC transporter permease [Sedimentisphaerales bacterium]